MPPPSIATSNRSGTVLNSICGSLLRSGMRWTRVPLRQVAEWVDPLVVVVHREVEVTTGGVARGSFPADLLSSRHDLPVADREAVHVTVQGLPAVAVHHDDVVAEAVRVVRLQVRDARVGGNDVVPARSCDVDAVVEVPRRTVRIVRFECKRSAAEALRDGPRVGPDEATVAAARREGRRLLRLEVGDLRVDLILHRGPLLRQLLVLRLQRSQLDSGQI